MNTLENKNLVSPITVYDEWNMLWETKIARNDKKQTLCVSVWGNTESESRVKANEFLEILCKIF